MSTHPEIPKGQYCYKYIDGQIKPCPHWQEKLIKGWPGAHCKFLNLDSEHQSTHNYVWDQIKECNENMEWDD